MKKLIFGLIISTSLLGPTMTHAYSLRHIDVKDIKDKCLDLTKVKHSDISKMWKLHFNCTNG